MTADSVWSHDDVFTIVNREFHSNTYLLRTTEDGNCVVLDPGLDREAIGHALRAKSWVPQAVLCTHGHFDHIGSAAWLQATYKVPVYLSAADLKLAKMSNFMLAAFRVPRRIELPSFDLIQDAERLVQCGGKSFRFHPLPGHTPGSSGICVDNLLFSGDSLYARKTALSQLPGENHAQLRQSLASLFSWIDGAVRVLPGHGGNASIDEIQEKNLELRAFMAGD